MGIMAPVRRPDGFRMPAFALDPKLAADTRAGGALALSDLRLMNDARFPWLLLVPRRAGVVEIIDLAQADRAALFEEITAVSAALQGGDRMRQAERRGARQPGAPAPRPRHRPLRGRRGLAGAGVGRRRRRLPTRRRRAID